MNSQIIDIKRFYILLHRYSNKLWDFASNGPIIGVSKAKIQIYLSQIWCSFLAITNDIFAPWLEGNCIQDFYYKI